MSQYSKFSNGGRTGKSDNPTLLVSLLPITLLIIGLAWIIITSGADAVQQYSPQILLSAALLSAVLSLATTRRTLRHLLLGMRKSARQILPAVPMLFFIGALASTWMLSGVVPAMIDYGLQMLDPDFFLMMACVACSVVSVLTGSSWTTIATLGVALMGIGSVMGFSHAWVAGAIISGAYFGDKVSPLSDTTVLASSSCEVPLFKHIRFLMITTTPSLMLALVVYAIVGFTTPTTTHATAMDMSEAIAETFVITPWLLIVPAITITLIVMRLHTTLVLALSSVAGLVMMLMCQPHIVAVLSAEFGAKASVILQVMCSSTAINSGNELLDSLVETSGMAGMIPTVELVISAMIFGGTMLGSGMIGTITQAISRRVHSAQRLVSVTVGSGLMLNSCTGDQYLSIILGSNIFKSAYKRFMLKPQVLSRALEDSISVTSVLIPWNSCGMTQSVVLGVATLTYLPCCIFNIASPITSIVVAYIGKNIYRRKED